MPIYEYRCQKCAKTFEQIAKMGEAPEAPGCSTCDGIGSRIFGAGIAIHTGAASSSFGDDFGMDDDFDMGAMGGMGGHGHGHDHGHSHDDFDFGDDDFDF